MASSSGSYGADSLKKMMYPRVFSTPVIHSGNIYVVGGCDSAGTPVESFEVYDTNKKKWTTLANMPTKRAAPAVQVVGDKIVAVGGVGESQQPVNAVEVYSIKEKKWKTLESLPYGILGISSAVRDNKMLCIGGMSTDTNPQDFFRSFDPEENLWMALQGMPTPRYATFSFLVNEKLYVIGGRQGKLPCPAFEMYDFETKKWKKLPPVPSLRVFAMYTCSDTHLFSVGGLIQKDNKGFCDTCEVFDLQTETWKVGEPLATKRGDFAVGMVGGKLVCAGGLGNLGKPLESVELYDWESNSWSKGKDLPVPHCSCAYIVHEDQLHVIGGLSSKGPTNCMETVCCRDHHGGRKDGDHPGGRKDGVKTKQS